MAALSNRLDSLQSRMGASDKLLTELREALAARTEEARDWERRAADAEGARGVSDRKLGLIESANTALERQVAELTQSRATLVERSGAAGKTLKLRETALARAEDKIAALSERVKQLESDNRALREQGEKRIEDLNGALNRERMARAVAEGALTSSRRDFARVQEEIASVNMQGIMRSGPDAQTPAALARRVKSNLNKAVAAAGEPAPKVRSSRKGADDTGAEDQAAKN
jgi:chromosome segregation ATPase